MPTVDVATIRATARAALLAHGADARAAGIMADAIAWAEGRGNRVCGLFYLESYCRQLVTGRLNAAAAPKVARPRPAVVAVDADDGFAQVAFDVALGTALEVAAAQGLASLAIGRAHTCTALGWFTERIAQAGFIGLGMTNASPIVAPPGGTRRVLGTNPVAFAVPDGAGGVAWAFDQATTVVTLGAVNMALAEGRAIPEGWAVDAEGRPTTDPAAALKGSLLPAGGAKGWGIAAMVEVMAAGLTGGRLSVDVAPLKAPEGAPHGLGQWFLLVDPGTSPAFADRLEGLIAAVEADGGGRLPGRNRMPAERVEVDAALWSTCMALAEG